MIKTVLTSTLILCGLSAYRGAPPEMPADKSILGTIKSLHIEHPDIVYAQAKLESANFTSIVFKENNNMFGMKRAGSRPSTAIGTNRGYAKYASVKEGIIDYALYQSAYMRGLTREQYLNKLSKRYAEDNNYKTKLIWMLKKS